MIICLFLICLFFLNLFVCFFFLSFQLLSEIIYFTSPISPSVFMQKGLKHVLFILVFLLLKFCLKFCSSNFTNLLNVQTRTGFVQRYYLKKHKRSSFEVHQQQSTHMFILSHLVTIHKFLHIFASHCTQRTFFIKENI